MPFNSSFFTKLGDRFLLTSTASATYDSSFELQLNPIHRMDIHHEDN